MPLSPGKLAARCQRGGKGSPRSPAKKAEKRIQIKVRGEKILTKVKFVQTAKIDGKQERRFTIDPQSFKNN